MSKLTPNSSEVPKLEETPNPKSMGIYSWIPLSPSPTHQKYRHVEAAKYNARPLNEAIK